MALSMIFAECLDGIAVPLAKFTPKFNNVFYEGDFPRRCLLDEQAIRSRLTKVNFDFSDEFYINEGELVRALCRINTIKALETPPKLER